MTEKEYRDLVTEERQILDRRYNVIQNYTDLHSDWVIQGLERWKRGVVRYRALSRSGKTQIYGYAKDEVFAAFQLPP